MSEPQVVRLQQEAAARVQRMAERSRRLVHEHPVNVYRGSMVEPCEAPPAAPTLTERCVPTKEIPRDKGLLSFLAGDEERTLLLLLILVLSQNGAPPQLLLALLYVAL